MRKKEKKERRVSHGTGPKILIPPKPLICPICRQNLGKAKWEGEERILDSHIREEHGICPVCFELLKTHRQCEVCTILIGSGHVEKELFDYRDLKVCKSCYNFLQKYPLHLLPKGREDEEL